MMFEFLEEFEAFHNEVTLLQFISFIFFLCRALCALMLKNYASRFNEH